MDTKDKEIKNIQDAIDWIYVEINDLFIKYGGSYNYFGDGVRKKMFPGPEDYEKFKFERATLLTEISLLKKQIIILSSQPENNLEFNLSNEENKHMKDNETKINLIQEKELEGDCIEQKELSDWHFFNKHDHEEVNLNVTTKF